MEVSSSLTCSTLASLHTHQMNIDYGQNGDCHVVQLLGLPWIKHGEWKRIRGLWNLRRQLLYWKKDWQCCWKDRPTGSQGRGQTQYGSRKYINIRRHTAEGTLVVHNGSLEHNLKKTTDYNQNRQGIVISQAMFNQTYCSVPWHI